MREKLPWITIAILGAIFATSHAQSPKNDQGPVTVARYQLLHFDDKGSVTTWKFDTATGQAWDLRGGHTPDGQPSFAWEPVPENAIPVPFTAH
jgi:hypothetical protein